jgi:predicted  nucleic acid-binding Zn-ribbon protein
MEELEYKANKAKKITEGLVKEKEGMNKEILELQNRLYDIDREINRTDDELEVCIDHKNFVEDLASSYRTASV